MKKKSNRKNKAKLHPGRLSKVKEGETRNISEKTYTFDLKTVESGLEKEPGSARQTATKVF